MVLKDAFDLPLEDIADILSTSVGAVKAALHRGRGKLADPDVETERTPVPAALDAFCAAFNAGDLDRVAALLLDGAAVEVVNASLVHGREKARTTVLPGMLLGSARMASPEDGGRGDGIDPRFIQGVLPQPARLEVRQVHGEPLLLSWYQHRDGSEAVRAVTRVEVDPESGKVARLWNYFFTPRSSPRSPRSSGCRTRRMAPSAAASGRSAERQPGPVPVHWGARSVGRGETGVRIAVSGTHRAGKSTLVEALAERLRGYRVVDEPYHLLEEEGFEFGDPPALDDWMEQLRRSLEELEGEASRIYLLERCPLDLVAYARVHEDRDALDLEDWVPRIREAMQTLDLVVFVPIEQPDRVPVGPGEDAGLRAAVDRELAAMLVDDGLGLELEVVRVEGSRAERVAQVLRRIR